MIDSNGDEEKVDPRVAALRRSIAVVADVRENLDLGENTEIFQAILSRVGGLLEHSQYDEDGRSGGDSFNLYTENDTVVDFVTIYPKPGSKRVIDVQHFTGSKSEGWEGYELNFPGSNGDNPNSVFVNAVGALPGLTSLEYRGESWEITREKVTQNGQPATISQAPLKDFLPRPLS